MQPWQKGGYIHYTLMSEFGLITDLILSEAIVIGQREGGWIRLTGGSGGSGRGMVWFILVSIFSRG